MVEIWRHRIGPASEVQVIGVVEHVLREFVRHPELQVEVAPRVREGNREDEGIERKRE